MFATRGFHSARVDDIVKVANTSHGTFYLYFSNKEDLFHALALDVADEAGRLADSLGPLTPTAEGRAELRRWLGDFAALHQRYGPIIRAWTEAEIGRSDVGRLGADVLGQFTTVLGEPHRRRSRRSKAAPTVAALALVAMIERFNYYVVADQVRSERDLMLDTLTAIAYASLFGGA